MFSDDEYMLAQLACQVAAAHNAGAAAWNAVVEYQDREEWVSPENCIDRAVGLLERAKEALNAQR